MLSSVAPAQVDVISAILLLLLLLLPGLPDDGWLAWLAREQLQVLVGSNPPACRKGLLPPVQVDHQVFSEFLFVQNHKHCY